MIHSLLYLPKVADVTPFLAPSERELSAQPTEGEKPIDRCINIVFLPLIYGQKNVACLRPFLPGASNGAAAAGYRFSLSFRGGHSDRRRTSAAAAGYGLSP